MSQPNSIRITSGSKMKATISHALQLLQDSTACVVLHTVPATLTFPPDSKSLSHATTSIPKLISVAEILKREYVKLLAEQHATRLIGLHQYNEIGMLEDLQEYKVQQNAELVHDQEQERERQVTHMLEGNKYLKQRQTPYMKVTLSLVELPDLILKGATYQSPTVRKISKSAKNRIKKRKRKEGEEKLQDT